MTSLRWSGVLLVVAAAFAACTVSVAYGFATEYGDTAAGVLSTMLDGLRWWWFGTAIVAVIGFGAVRLAGRSRAVRAVAGVLVGVTFLGTGIGAAVGVERKFDRFRAVPDCVGEFTGGPALRVVRAAQAGFEELDHPGRFGGGGYSGVDGCSTQLELDDGEDPTDRYRVALAAAGWRVEADKAGLLRATKGRQAFELAADVSGWTVWIGPAQLGVPAQLGERTLEEGQVGPRG